ncbi:vacuolar fusion protein CCZ1 homolog [Ruditapes philippinarum]|uniref:vacuolar fusion protein CCZ1 homolog n=1 Tax=Ruditapes philippinarum TaxID=129788 RepID=UPI00295AAD31|nr:vacuolar fusion protein CCZ1 homolog [Ruditapes philippinarum]XP_060572400.1 vacuolar fusion protein CCZ1 homolog [Ruditapes philippinarum]XP_060572401.1 vacuolar fusion protein CCZ1 homolog [Ruditapes philippinarum]
MSKGQVVLKNFFIFNPTYGPREGEEHKKIMFYFPKNTDIDTQIKTIGLCEAIVTFTHTFSDRPCESLHTQKTRQLFFQPEKDFWMVMTVSVPFSEKTKEGQSYIEYHEEDVQDPVMDSILKQAYRMFTLFNGSIYYLLEKVNGQTHSLQQRLDHFFSRYLLTLRLGNSDLLDVFSGISFLPLDKNTYLKVQCFINILESTFPGVKYTAFLYNDQLVWSGLEQDDMRIMYKYLTTSLFPAYLEAELQSSGQQHTSPSLSRNMSMPTLGNVHFGKFITGPPNVHDEKNMGKIPRLYINTEFENEECFLLVYRALSASVCLLLNSSTEVNSDLCKKLDSFLGQQLSNLASEIGEQYSSRKQQPVSEPIFKYIYFNHMNLAQKTTVHVESRKSNGVYVHQDTLKLLCDISSDLQRNNQDGETFVKTMTDCWVVGKKSDQREMVVVINQKNLNLIEVNDEVKKLCSLNFNSIFFQD